MNRIKNCQSTSEFAQSSPDISFYRLNVQTLLSTLITYAGLVFILMFIFFGQSVAQTSLLDPSFDGDGKVFTQFLPTNNVATNAVLQPDGKIIVVGSASIGPTSPQTKQAAIIRYNPDGSLDTSFDGDGKVSVVVNSSQTSEIKAAALQPDGKLVAVGTVGSSFPVNGFILRLNPDGSLDTTFDGDGKLTVFISSSNEASDMALQPDGKILLAGRAGGGAFIARFNTDGSFDTGFGTNQGFTITILSNGFSFFNKIALLADGKIALTGKAQLYTTLRYTQNGLLDNSFGTNGVVSNNIGGNAIIQQPDDGKLIIVNNSQSDFTTFVWRINYDGTLDSTFGSNGFRLLYFDGERVELEPDYDVALDADGKIVIGGSIRFKTTSDHTSVAPDREFVVRRLNRDGSDDLYFGFRGFVATDLGGIDSGTGLLIQPDGKIVLAGYSNDGGSFAVLRYLPITANNPCRPVGDFNGDGKSDLAYVTNNALWNYRSSLNGNTLFSFIGSGSDIIVPGDYNGDCYEDFAIYRADGSWEIRSSADDTNTYQYQLGGQPGDKPVPADYDGDDWADPAVYRNGTWVIHQTRAGDLTVQFGIAGDIPVPADYDGDGKDDVAVYRDGTWYLLQSSLGVGIVQWGLAGDKPVVGDYDGDGRADIAVYRPSDGTWYLLQSTLGFGAVRWGIATDRPVPADYDGDGKTDIAVYRDGDWYLLQSTVGYQFRTFGGATDRPVQNAYIP